MRLVLFLIVFPSLAHAYGPKNINLSEFGFNRYVRPQLINITQEYLNLVTTLNPELKKMQSLNRHFIELEKDFVKIKEYYKFQQTDLLSSKISKSLNHLRKTIEILNTAPNLAAKTYFTGEDLLISFHEFFNFKSSVNNLYLRYENMYFLSQANIPPPVTLEQLKFEINHTYNQYHLYLLKSSDSRFRSEFISFWSDFIKPIQQMILPQSDKKLFIHKLNKLNLRLNFLNARLTKRNQKISKQVKTILNIIHNRWNSILKVTLKRHR